MEKALSFDDVLLVPRRSHLSSRSEVSLTTNVAGLELEMPIIAANMPSVCGGVMAGNMAWEGGLGIIHRMNTLDDQSYEIHHSRRQHPFPEGILNVGASIGIDAGWKQRTESCLEAGANIICIDVAHAHHDRTIEVFHTFLKEFPYIPIVVGNIATGAAVYDLLLDLDEHELGRIALKVGIGGGSVCTTRIETGCGVPTFQSLLSVVNMISINDWDEVSIIADGGIKSSGDIVKCLAAGANAVMLGSMLAGTTEAPGETFKHGDALYKIYRGNASWGSKEYNGQDVEHVEGAESFIPYKGKLNKILTPLNQGIRSGFSYCGSNNLEELQNNAEFVEITSAGMAESKPHLLK